MTDTAYAYQDTSWSFANLTATKTQYLTHGYHRYPAKFIPQLVSRLIDEYSRHGNCICDPFGGCGTTLVEAKLAGRPSFGFDINPLAVLITRAKTTPIYPNILSDRLAKMFLELKKETVSISKIPKSRINRERLLYWFGNSNLEQLLSLKTQIEKEKVPSIRRFFLCALSHVLKNCSYWLTKSTKSQKDPNKVPKSPIKMFKIHALYMMDKNRALFHELMRRGFYETPVIMKKADARNLPLPHKCMELIITSPPYSTSYDYPDIHQLSMLLFGFCTSLRKCRRDFIGSKYNNHNRDEILQNLRAFGTLESLRKSDINLARAVYNYFLDMNQVYREIHRVLRNGGRACIVIGNTELRGISIPNVEIAIEQMEKVGFVLEKMIRRPILGRVLTPYRDRNNGRFTSSRNSSAKKVYNHEYILVMRKSDANFTVRGQ